MQTRPDVIPFVQLAPMEGVLDWILRELLSEVGGFDRMVTEFVRVTDRLLPDHVFYRYCPELENGGRTRSGVPVFIQLLGGQPGPLAENAARATELGAPGIDLNFGCPAKTVNRHDGGAALLKNPERLYHILKAVSGATSAPVTAKVRLGFDHKDFHREIAQAAEEGGAQSLVVHARTKAEMYTKPAHWDYIARMREGRRIPFLANGEIWSVEDYLRCVAISGVERVALGRGVVRKPTLALEIRNLAHARPHGRIRFAREEFLQRFFSMSLAYRGDRYAVARMKQVLRYWSIDDTEASIWFNHVKRCMSAHEIINFLKEINLCQQSKFTPGPIAPTACAPRIY